MRYAHSLKLTAFSYEQENSHDILNSFIKFFPFSLEENKIPLKKSFATGFSDKKIEILEIKITKQNLINHFLKNLLSNLDENTKKIILGQLESRLDSNLDFFLRFDKNSWISERKLKLTDTGKCFHLKISVAAFPKKREVALNILKNLFEN